MTKAKPLALSLLGTAAMASVAFANPVSEGGRKLTTALSGANEVPPTTETATGTAAITVNPGQKRVCWEVTTVGPWSPGTTGITGAHIHSGHAGQNGAIVVPITAVLEGTSTGCVDVARDLADAIRKAPQAYYVNVHTNIFPGGAIRGQLG